MSALEIRLKVFTAAYFYDQISDINSEAMSETKRHKKPRYFGSLTKA